jgi:hypothetical protein
MKITMKTTFFSLEHVLLIVIVIVVCHWYTITPCILKLCGPYDHSSAYGHKSTDLSINQGVLYVAV